VVAKADESKARAYLKSLGISVGKMTDNFQGAIFFDVSDFDSAKKILIKKFGKPSGGHQIKIVTFKFKVQDGRYILLSKGSRSASVALLDDND
jgi:predicted 3-demethylubiquinone-9 3-methyltransferase (glyoxalase superfamily)